MFLNQTLKPVETNYKEKFITEILSKEIFLTSYMTTFDKRFSFSTWCKKPWAKFLKVLENKPRIRIWLVRDLKFQCSESSRFGIFRFIPSLVLWNILSPYSKIRSSLKSPLSKEKRKITEYKWVFPEFWCLELTWCPINFIRTFLRDCSKTLEGLVKN